MITTIIISAFTIFIIGFLAHGPIAGKLWMKLANIHPTGDEKFKDMLPQMFWNLLTNIITASILYIIISFVSTSIGNLAWYQGMMVAELMWFGFIMPSTAIEVIWMKRSLKLWLFECVVSIINFGVIGSITASLL